MGGTTSKHYATIKLRIKFEDDLGGCFLIEISAKKTIHKLTIKAVLTYKAIMGKDVSVTGLRVGGTGTTGLQNLATDPVLNCFRITRAQF